MESSIGSCSLMVVLCFCQVIHPLVAVEQDDQSGTDVQLLLTSTRTTLEVHLKQINITELDMVTITVNLLDSSSQLLSSETIDLKTLTPPALLHTFDNLTPGSAYKIQAQVYKGKQLFIEKIFPVATEPSPVRSVNVQRVDLTTMLVTWTPSTGNVDMYSAKLLQGSQSKGLQEIPGDGVPLGVVFYHIDPNARYNVSVYTYGANGKYTYNQLQLTSPFKNFPATFGSIQPSSVFMGERVRLYHAIFLYLSEQNYDIQLNFKYDNYVVSCDNIQRPNNDMITCDIGDVIIDEPLFTFDAALTITMIPQTHIFYEVTLPQVQITISSYSTVQTATQSEPVTETETSDVPKVLSIFPYHTVIRGGVTLTVKGTDLDQVDDPKMTFSFTCANGPEISLATSCKLQTVSQLACPSPDFTEQINNTQCIIPVGPQIMQVAMAGAAGPVALPPSASFLIHQCPNIARPQDDMIHFRPKWHYNEKHIDIVGSGFGTLNPQSYTVLVGSRGHTCEVKSVADDRIICIPPAEEPPSSGDLTLQMQLGNCPSAFLGHLKYWDLLSSPVVKGLIIAGAALILLLFLIWCCCCLCRRRKAKVAKSKKDFVPDNTPDYLQPPHNIKPMTKESTWCCVSTTEKYTHDQDPYYLTDQSYKNRY